MDCELQAPCDTQVRDTGQQTPPAAAQDLPHLVQGVGMVWCPKRRILGCMAAGYHTHISAAPPSDCNAPNLSALPLCRAAGTSPLPRETLESSRDTARADSDGDRASPGLLQAGRGEKPGHLLIAKKILQTRPGARAWLQCKSGSQTLSD